MTLDEKRELLVKLLKQNAAKPTKDCCGGGPSFVRKVVNYAKSTTRHVMAGMPKVTEEIKAARLALCVVCPEYNARHETCNKCGCNLSAKTVRALEKCPIGKW